MTADEVVIGSTLRLVVLQSGEVLDVTVQYRDPDGRFKVTSSDGRMWLAKASWLREATT